MTAEPRRASSASCDRREGNSAEMPEEPHLALYVYDHPSAYQDFGRRSVEQRLAPRAMVEVGAYTARSDAEIAQAVLAAAGIPSTIAADDAGGAYPFDLSGAARLLVDGADANAAATVLSDQFDAPRKEQP